MKRVIINKIIAVATYILITSCAVQNNFTPNTTLLIPYTEELDKKEQFRFPFVANYHKNGKELIYIATDHGVGMSPTYKTIKVEVERFKPDFIIIEGLDIQHKKNIIEQANLCKKVEFKNCIEIFYATWLASSNNINFTSGEPTDNEIIDKIIIAGYTKSDLDYFYLVRQIPQWKKEGKLLNDHDFDK